MARHEAAPPIAAILGGLPCGQPGHPSASHDDSGILAELSPLAMICLIAGAADAVSLAASGCGSGRMARSGNICALALLVIGLGPFCCQAPSCSREPWRPGGWSAIGIGCFAWQTMQHVAEPAAGSPAQHPGAGAVRPDPVLFLAGRHRRLRGPEGCCRRPRYRLALWARSRNPGRRFPANLLEGRRGWLRYRERLGILVALLVDRSPFLQRGLLPLGNFISAVPVIGIAPIMVMVRLRLGNRRPRSSSS